MLTYDDFHQQFEARDPRLEGRVFAAITTSGVYCRPGCPGRPKRENRRFYPSAEAARRAGFRSCKRCHPDEAPVPARKILYTRMSSPVGELLLVGDELWLRKVYMPNHRGGPSDASDWRRADQPFAAAREQLDEYFAGERRDFDLPLAPEGTPFQQRVWSALGEIPYGETRTYGEIAEQIGRPRAARAVGLANGRNPISIIVPCHRVIGSDRSLTGYGAGVERKRQLLELEAHGSGLARRSGAPLA
jgi:methylated-DNA-[protein]-cysteine S-methyltransferase